MNNIKKYNIFIFFTTITKSMIDIFIPIILFNKGLSFNKILLFFLFKYIFLLLFTNIIKMIKIKNNILLIISSFISIITYFLLYFYKLNFAYLILITLFYALYLTTYWIPRHNIALSLIENKKTTERSSKFIIITILGIIPSSLIGGYLINNSKFWILILLISVFTFISLFFISNNYKQQKKKKITSFPLKNKIYLFLEQFKFISIALFPLYIYENVNNSFTYVGLINTTTALASILSIFFLAKLMDKKKKDFLGISCFLLAISWILKLIFKNQFLFILITIFEGVFRFNLDTIILRDIYSYGREYEPLSYNTYIEITKNISRILILIFIIIFKFNLITIIIFGIISLFISSIIKFDDGKYGYN